MYLVFKALENTSSRLEKEQILRNNINYEDFKKVLFLALDPYTQFYIRKIPDFEYNTHTLSWEDVFVNLADISERKITGNAAIDRLRWILENVHPEVADTVIRIISKDLKCGVSTATVNKIFPGLIPTYPVMLASGYDEKTMAKMRYPAYVQLKLDGMRFNAIVNNGKVELKSRNGKTIEIHNVLDESFLALSISLGIENCVFDGELIVKETDGTIMNRQKGNGILNKAVKGTISEKEANMIHATIWDYIPLNDFKNGHCDKPYETRFRALKDGSYGLASDKINIIKNYIVNSESEAQTIFEEFLSNGEEGIILKNIFSPWEDKRVKHQVKFKGELDCDLICVDWQEGTGKNVGKLGALVLESADGKIRVNVGSGFTDEQRDKYTREETVGKIVAVKYNARIKDKNSDVESLFLPIFLEIREDKFTADDSTKIK